MACRASTGQDRQYWAPQLQRSDSAEGAQQRSVTSPTAQGQLQNTEGPGCAEPSGPAHPRGQLRQPPSAADGQGAPPSCSLSPTAPPSMSWARKGIGEPKEETSCPSTLPFSKWRAPWEGEAAPGGLKPALGAKMPDSGWKAPGAAEFRALKRGLGWAGQGVGGKYCSCCCCSEWLQLRVTNLARCGACNTYPAAAPAATLLGREVPARTPGRV